MPVVSRYLDEPIYIQSVQKVRACDCFLNNSRTKGDRDLRFSPLDSHDDSASFSYWKKLSIGFPKSTFLEIFGKLADKSKTLHKDLLIFLHIRNQHRKLSQLIYVSNRFRNLFFRRKPLPQDHVKKRGQSKRGFYCLVICHFVFYQHFTSCELGFHCPSDFLTDLIF